MTMSDLVQLLGDEYDAREANNGDENEMARIAEAITKLTR